MLKHYAWIDDSFDPSSPCIQSIAYDLSADNSSSILTKLDKFKCDGKYVEDPLLLVKELCRNAVAAHSQKLNSDKIVIGGLEGIIWILKRIVPMRFNFALDTMQTSKIRWFF